MRGAALLFLAGLTACTCGDPPAPADAGPTDGGAAAVSTKNDLVWRRARAFEQSLMSALLIEKDQVCSELRRFDCVDFVHQVALGGNDPFEQSLYEPLAQPGATSTVAVDRVVLSACRAAVENDRARAVTLVFRGVDLEAASLDVGDPEVATGVAFLVASLYQRLHGRQPTPPETTKVRELLVDDDGAAVTAADFALLACFAVASTTEGIFF